MNVNETTEIRSLVSRGPKIDLTSRRAALLVAIYRQLPHFIVWLSIPPHVYYFSVPFIFL